MSLQNSRRRVDGSYEPELIEDEELVVVEEYPTSGYSGKIAYLDERPLRLNDGPGIDAAPRVWDALSAELTEVETEPAASSQFRVDYQNARIQFHSSVAVDDEYTITYYGDGSVLRAADYTETGTESYTGEEIVRLLAGFIPAYLLPAIQTVSFEIQDGEPIITLNSTKLGYIGPKKCTFRLTDNADLQIFDVVRNGDKLHVKRVGVDTQSDGGITIDGTDDDVLIGVLKESPTARFHVGEAALFDALLESATSIKAPTIEGTSLVKAPTVRPVATDDDPLEVDATSGFLQLSTMEGLPTANPSDGNYSAIVRDVTNRCLWLHNSTNWTRLPVDPISVRAERTAADTLSDSSSGERTDRVDFNVVSGSARVWGRPMGQTGLYTLTTGASAWKFEALRPMRIVLSALVHIVASGATATGHKVDLNAMIQDASDAYAESKWALLDQWESDNSGLTHITLQGSTQVYLDTNDRVYLEVTHELPASSEISPASSNYSYIDIREV